MRRTRIGFVVGLVVVVMALVGCGGDDEDAARTTETETTTATTPADESTLSASVGPGFEISLAGANGAELPPLGRERRRVDRRERNGDGHVAAHFRRGRVLLRVRPARRVDERELRGLRLKGALPCRSPRS